LIEANNKVSNEVSVFKVYKMLIHKERKLYMHMNMLKQNGMRLEGLIWAPEYINFEKKVQEVIQAQNLTGLSYEKGPDSIPGLAKPTLFRTNEFTETFQEIVNTYGIPNYKEVNPGFFTCVTFPFLFGVMYGDLFHGSLLMAFGVYLCWAKAEAGTLANTLAPVKYLFLLMGIFATFCGLIYNDYTSTATSIFGDGCYKAEQ